MDIYFEEKYAKLYETNREKVEIFEYSNEIGKGRNIFLKREIPLKKDNRVYYDIITPYGYGGPIFEIKNEINKQKFIDEYFEKFSEYCKKNNIVSEFIRFHPLEKNYENLEKIYQIEHISDTIFIDLSSIEILNSNLGSQAKRNIKKAIKNNLLFKEDENLENKNVFKELYYKTMDKNHAIEMYYFSDKYFEKIFSLKKIKLFNAIYNGEIVSSFLILLGDNFIHYHLAGNSEKGYELGASHFLFYKISEWGIKNGYIKFHLGGGYGGNESSLFKFKYFMNKNGILKFCIGKKIYNKEIYEELVKQRNLTEGEKKSCYFPLYRI